MNLRAAVFFSLLPLLASCGGGSGSACDNLIKPSSCTTPSSSSGTTSSARYYNLLALYQRYVKDEFTSYFTATATCSSDKYTASYTKTAPVAVMLSNSYLFSFSESSRNYFDNSCQFSANTTTYTNLKYEPIATSDYARNFIITNNLPTEAKIGDAGKFYQASIYNDSTFTKVVGKLASDYLIESDGTLSESAIVTYSLVNYDINNKITSSTIYRFRLFYVGSYEILSIKFYDGNNNFLLTSE